MRHTWYADQATTVLLHFCHHLPTDFFHIPVWMGGLDFLSISSPLTVSRQKAPLVRFLAQQLITQSGVFWLRGCRRVESLALTSICQQHLYRPAPRPGGWAVNCQNSPGPGWRIQCQVSSTNYQLQLPSVTFINMSLMGGRAFWRLCHFRRFGTWKAPWLWHYPRQADRTGRLELWEPREQLCTNKPWKAWITL